MHVGIANMSHTCRKHTGARTESLGMLAAQGDSSQWMTHGFVKCHRAAKHLKALVTSVTTKQKMKTPPSHRSTESAACGPCEALSLQACRPERSGIVPDCRRHNRGGIRHATLRLGGLAEGNRFPALGRVSPYQYQQTQTLGLRHLDSRNGPILVPEATP